MKRVILIVLTIAVATGCSVFKKYSRPENISTDKLFGEKVVVSDTTSMADISWREFFRDKLLQEYIEQGLNNNIDMQIAAHRIVEAEATLRASKLAFLPTVGYAPALTTDNNKYYSRQGRTAFGYSLPVSASWEINPGTLLNSKRRAQAALEQSRISRQSIETQVVASIANLYYTLLMLDAQLAISESTAASWKENVRIMRAMKDAGMTNEASISQTEANSCSIDASLFDLRYEIVQVENALALVLGTTPQTFERGTLAEQQFNGTLKTGVPAQLLSRRPDVQKAEYSLKLAFYNTNVARSAFYPSLVLTGSGGWEDAFTRPASWFFSFAAKLAGSIFNGGKNDAALKIAKAQQESALATFRQTLLTAGSEVNNALAQCKTASSKTDIRNRQIAALESAVYSTQQLMRHSESTYLEVLTAQQSLLSAQLLQIADQFEGIQGTINLYRALGGGVDSVLDDESEDAPESGKVKRGKRKK